jgi:hypothetical protein
MTPSMPVVHLELHTGDQVRATAFYARLLHWRPELVRAACGSDLTLDTGTTLGGYVPFVSQAREQTTGELAHMHWLTYTKTRRAFPESTKTAHSPRSLTAASASSRSSSNARTCVRCTCLEDRTRRARSSSLASQSSDLE